jgi:Zn-dependent peptidase ImmA (M78 family)
LLPAREIAPQLSRLSLPKLAALKREWKVSMGALIEQAARWGMLSQSQRSRLITYLRSTTHSFREPEETDIPIEMPTLLDELIQTHLKDLGYSVGEVSAMVDEFESEFTKKYLPTPKVLQFALKLSS